MSPNSFELHFRLAILSILRSFLSAFSFCNPKASLLSESAGFQYISAKMTPQHERGGRHGKCTVSKIPAGHGSDQLLSAAKGAAEIGSSQHGAAAVQHPAGPGDIVPEKRICRYRRLGICDLSDRASVRSPAGVPLGGEEAS